MSEKEYDTERQAILESRGLRFLRFPNDAVLSDILSVVDVITKVCEEQIERDLTPFP